MRISLTSLLAVAGATILPAAARAQANKPMAPGIYFLWSPPGPQTVTPDHPVGPNTNWIAEQTGRRTSWGLDLPGPVDPEAAVRHSGALRRPEAPYLLDRMWYRLAATRPGDRAPDLSAGGADQVPAGQPVTLWISNEGVTADDRVFVSVRVDLSGATEGNAKPIFSTTTAALPPGSYDSKLAVPLGPLPVGKYRVTIEAQDPVTGRSLASIRTLLVQ